MGRFLEWMQGVDPGEVYNIYAPGAIPLFIKGMLHKEVNASNVVKNNPVPATYTAALTISLSSTHYRSGRFYLDAAVIRAIDSMAYEAMKDELHRRLLIDLTKPASEQKGQKKLIYDFMDEVGIIDMPNVSYESLKKALIRRHAARRRKAKKINLGTYVNTRTSVPTSNTA